MNDVQPQQPQQIDLDDAVQVRAILRARRHALMCLVNETQQRVAAAGGIDTATGRAVAEAQAPTMLLALCEGVMLLMSAITAEQKRVIVPGARFGNGRT